MGRRLQLHQILTEIAPNVYFQPPEDLKMSYPCIVYQRDYADTKFADNEVYSHTPRYQLTVIDQDPDGEIREKVAALPRCLYTRFFAANQLNHDVFSLYF